MKHNVVNQLAHIWQHFIDHINVTIQHFGRWLQHNETLLFNYVINIIVAILILIIGNLLAKAMTQLTIKLMQAKNLDITVTRFLSSIIRYTILIVALIAAMSHVGIQTTSLIAVLGAAGLAIGLALQGSLSNFAAGVLLVIFRPFRSGEYVDLGGVKGNVIEIQIFSTTIATKDGKIIIVPNNKILNSNIINYTREPNRRIELIIGVAYDANIEQVKKVLHQIVKKHPAIHQQMPITIRLNEMASSSLNFIVRVWTRNGDYQETIYDLLETIKVVFDQYNISMPYAQLDVHLYQTDPILIASSKEGLHSKPKGD